MLTNTCVHICNTQPAQLSLETSERTAANCRPRWRQSYTTAGHPRSCTGNANMHPVLTTVVSYDISVAVAQWQIITEPDLRCIYFSVKTYSLSLQQVRAPGMLYPPALLPLLDATGHVRYCPFVRLFPLYVCSNRTSTFISAWPQLSGDYTSRS